MSRLLSTLATVWRLASPYFLRSEDRWAGRILLGAVVAIELSLVGITVLLNQWNNRFYNALQERNWDTFVWELEYFCVLAAIFIVLAVYQLYLNQWLQIRWRRFMTTQFLEHWLSHANHYRMQLLGDAADNPDQRIAEDVRQFIDGGTGTGVLPIGLGFLSSVVTLASFVVILWTLSGQASFHLFGIDLSVPGYLVWAALLYAVVGTFFTHLIGRPLIALNFTQQQYEADFRFNLVRVRENAEQVALLAGEPAERRRLLDRFANVVHNWHAIMSRQKKIRAFTAGYEQVSTIFPFVVVSPAYFAGTIQLGGLMQTASAFGSVQGAFSFFVSTYRQIADWRAVVERLDGFERTVALASRAAVNPPVISVGASDNANSVILDGLDLRLPDDRPLLTAARLEVKPGEHVLVNGPSGSGKSTLFRAIAGIWPFGTGSITMPKGASIMVLPQQPYLPIGTLKAAVVYPALPDSFDSDLVREALQAVGLAALAGRLDDAEHWNRMLSPGEQQRLGLARALLHAPDYLFLDEATASLDEPTEAELYKLVERRLPNATIVSIGHRSTLNAFHTRFVRLERAGDRSVLQPQLPAAAS